MQLQMITLYHMILLFLHCLALLHHILLVNYRRHLVSESDMLAFLDSTFGFLHSGFQKGLLDDQQARRDWHHLLGRG